MAVLVAIEFEVEAIGKLVDCSQSLDLATLFISRNVVPFLTLQAGVIALLKNAILNKNRGEFAGAICVNVVLRFTSRTLSSGLIEDVAETEIFEDAVNDVRGRIFNKIIHIWAGFALSLADVGETVFGDGCYALSRNKDVVGGAGNAFFVCIVE